MKLGDQVARQWKNVRVPEMAVETTITRFQDRGYTLFSVNCLGLSGSRENMLDYGLLFYREPPAVEPETEVTTFGEAAAYVTGRSGNSVKSDYNTYEMDAWQKGYDDYIQAGSRSALNPPAPDLPDPERKTKRTLLERMLGW